MLHFYTPVPGAEVHPFGSSPADSRPVVPGIMGDLPASDRAPPGDDFPGQITEPQLIASVVHSTTFEVESKAESCVIGPRFRAFVPRKAVSGRTAPWDTKRWLRRLGPGTL